MKRGWVYIMTNKHQTTFYIGVTSDLRRRVMEHKKGIYPLSFTLRYLCHALIWFQEYASIKEAIAMEKRIKRWRRAWKEEMIKELNPGRKDLSEDWYHERDFEA